MKCRSRIKAAAVLFFVLSATTAFGFDVGIIGDLNVTSNLGIGTSTPNQPIHIVESTTKISYPLKLDNQNPTISGATEGAMTGILFSTGGSGAGRGKGALVYETTNTWNRGTFHFLQEPSADQSNPDIVNAVLSVANNGNIGIGVPKPGVKLDVTGWIRARNGYGDSISIGGDNANGDLEILISAPAERNKISFWNSQLQSGVDLGVRTISAENMNITGNITTAPKTSYLSISPHAFNLRGCGLESINPYIYFSGDPRFPCYAYAPVNLPHGSTIMKFTAYWYYNYDGQFGSGSTLHRARFTESNHQSIMGQTGVNGLYNGVREYSDTTIDDPVVDNQHYTYFIEMLFWDAVPELDGQFYGVVIEYTYTSP